jgi:NUMOD1 domain
MIEIQKQRSKKIAKPIKAYNTLTKETVEFPSIAQAWKSLELKKSNIIAYLKGRYNGKSYKGWQFTYC